MNKFSFNPEDWKTPNTYDNNFMMPPNLPGVYLLVVPTFFINDFSRIDWSIKYVGSSINLKQRFSRHEVKRHLENQDLTVHFYFKITENFRDIEKQLIKSIQPQYNKQWR